MSMYFFFLLLNNTSIFKKENRFFKFLINTYSSFLFCFIKEIKQFCLMNYYYYY